MYQIHFKETGHSIPTIFSLLKAITIALDYVLDSLKEIYKEKDGQHQLLYLCVAEERIKV